MFWALQQACSGNFHHGILDRRVAEANVLTRIMYPNRAYPEWFTIRVNSRNHNTMSTRVKIIYSNGGILNIKEILIRVIHPIWYRIFPFAGWRPCNMRLIINLNISYRMRWFEVIFRDNIQNHLVGWVSSINTIRIIISISIPSPSQVKMHPAILVISITNKGMSASRN